MKDDKLTSKVYEYISNKVQNGDYKENQRITETEICLEFGVSRTPAREVLNILSGKKLLEKVPNKGFILREFSQKEKTDTYTVIGTLDSLAGVLSTNKLEVGDITKMKELSEMMDIAIKYRNYNNYLSISNDYHNVYRYKCDNEVLLEQINVLIYNFIPKSYTSDDEEELFDLLEHSNKEHMKLIEAFTNKDVDKIERIIKNHWMSVPIQSKI
ncbi:MAG: GntR family transcriptional regulator [Terrisporobacter sp.]